MEEQRWGGEGVKRFHAHRLAALSVAPGAGRKPTDPGQQVLLVTDGQRTSSRLDTGDALRMRTSETVRIFSPQTPENNE
jgi:hypothetical protein